MKGEKKNDTSTYSLHCREFCVMHVPYCNWRTCVMCMAHDAFIVCIFKSVRDVAQDVHPSLCRQIEILLDLYTTHIEQEEKKNGKSYVHRIQ